MKHRAYAVMLILLAAASRALAVPISVCAIEYGLSTCPHCIHLKETLTRLGIPFLFVDVNANRTDAEEYMSLYSALVGGTYYVPFTVFIVNGTARLAVVGDRDAAEILRLLRTAVNASGLLLSVEHGDERRITDAGLIELANSIALRRAPEPALIVLPGAAVTGDARLLTPFGTPMALADVLVSCPDGVQYRGTSDRTGRVQLTCAEANVTILYWMGLPVNRTIEARIGAEITVPGIGRLTVMVRDILGRPVPGASLSLTRGRVELVGETGDNGSITVDLPEGEYTITISKGGKASSVKLEVSSGKHLETALTLDVLWATQEIALGLREIAATAITAALAAAAALLLRRRATGGPREGSREGRREVEG